MRLKILLSGIAFILLALGSWFFFTNYKIVAKDESPSSQENKNPDAYSLAKHLDDFELDFERSLSFNPIDPGFTMIDFKLTNIKSKEETTLYELSKDKDYSILLYMQSWCPYCRQEMESLDKFFEKNKRDDFQLIVFSDEKDKVKELLDIANEGGFDNFETYVSEDNHLAKEYGLSSVPVELFFDQDKNIIGASMGFKEWNKDEVERAFFDLLNSK